MGQGGEDAPGFSQGLVTDAVQERMPLNPTPVWLMHAESCRTNLGNIQASNLCGGGAVCVCGGVAPAIVPQRMEVNRQPGPLLLPVPAWLQTHGGS